MASSLPTHILVIGATGNIGKFITDGLIQTNPANAKISIFTSKETALSKAGLLDQWKAAGVDVLIGDIANSVDVTRCYHDVDTVVSCLGRNALGLQKELIRLAEESSSIQRFFPSEYGTDIEHNPQSAEEKPHQMKLSVRKYIRENTKRLRVTYVVVGPYFEMWVDGGQNGSPLGGFDIKAREATLISDGEGLIGFTTMPDVGKAVAAALQHGDECPERIWRISSFVASPRQVLEEYERQLGATFAVRTIPLQELKGVEQRLVQEGNPLGTVATLRRIWATGGTLYEKWDNESIGLGSADMESLSAAVAREVQKIG